MNKEKANSVAGAITQLLTLTELSEAEAVYALMVGSTMRLAMHCDTLEQLKERMEQLEKIWHNFLPANLELFRLALEAKKEHEKAQQH